MLQDPHQQRSGGAYRLKGDLNLCVDAICALCAWLLRHPDAHLKSSQAWRCNGLASARVFGELEAKRLRRVQKEEEGEEELSDLY